MPALVETPCVVISLHADSERTLALLAQLAGQGVDARVFDAVDGRHGLPALQAGERLDSAATRWRHLCELKNSEIGCYLSHLRAIRDAYDKGLNRLCIVEDDVQLEPDFGAVLRELEQLPGDIEMVRLMGLKMRLRKIVRPLHNGSHHLVRPERGWTGTQGYLLNRSGMKKILDHGSRIFEPIDKLYDHFFEYDLRVYGVEPHLLWEDTQTSSIVKSNVARARVAWWLYCLHPLGKLWRSLRRHRYLRRHRREFYPAERPREKTGRTARIKRDKANQL